MAKEKTHHKGTWGCGSWSGKKLTKWRNVTCEYCHNNRRNHEHSALVMYASFVLNGVRLKEFMEESYKRSPDFKRFDEVNYSANIRKILKEMNAISLVTSKLKTVQARYNYAKSKGKTDATYFILGTASGWFSKHYVDKKPLTW